MADPLLEVSNIETFYGPIMAIRGVSFTVERGAIVTILGANGAGKTTILKTVAGVMEPQKGTVRFEGREIQGKDPDILFYIITCGMIAFFAYNWQNQGWFLRIFFLLFGSFWFFLTAITGPAAVFSSSIIPLILGGIILLHLLFLYLLKAPTLQGRHLMDQVEGFKMYLAVAEKERLQLLHPPDKTPELFEKYLPYAFALDVENEWSEQFAEVLAQAQKNGQSYAPAWYEGSSWNSQNFSGLAAGLGSSLSSSIAAAATPPSSSSGSGGGGSSGGGGGGGGGSGW